MSKTIERRLRAYYAAWGGGDPDAAKSGYCPPMDSA